MWKMDLMEGKLMTLEKNFNAVLAEDGTKCVGGSLEILLNNF
jgi:hypothetical protein